MLAIALSGCSASQANDAPRGSAHSSIVGGSDSDDTQNAVVRITNQVVAGGPLKLCTGTLVAPNLVLTARHCVSRTDSSPLCRPDGTNLGGNALEDYDPAQMYVYVGNALPLYPNPSGRDTPDGVGARLIHEGGKNLCGRDLALIVLAEPIAGAKTAPIRLDAPPLAGEPLFAVGWGRTKEYQLPPVRQQRELSVTELGPIADLGGYGSMAASEFLTSEGPCFGDSGGPALAKGTGAVIGVESRVLGKGSGDSNPGDACIGSDMRGMYTQPAALKEVILEGFEAAGAEPWFEGQPNPLLGKSGVSCTTNEDCRSNACIAVGQEKACAPLDCKREACPSGYACGADDAGRPLCQAVPKPDPIVVEETSCTFRARSSRDGSVLLFGAMLIAAGFVARRRARTTS